jgi:hypothetical protein
MSHVDSGRSPARYSCPGDNTTPQSKGGAVGLRHLAHHSATREHAGQEPTHTCRRRPRRACRARIEIPTRMPRTSHHRAKPARTALSLATGPQSDRTVAREAWRDRYSRHGSPARAPAQSRASQRRIVCSRRVVVPRYIHYTGFRCGRIKTPFARGARRSRSGRAPHRASM